MKNKAVIRVPCDAVRFSTRRGSPGPNASNGCGDMGDDESGPRRRYHERRFPAGSELGGLDRNTPVIHALGKSAQDWRIGISADN